MNNKILNHCCIRVVASLLLITQAACLKNYTFDELLPCTLSTVELAKIGPNDYVEPCIIFDVRPEHSPEVDPNKTATIPFVHVTPSICGNHRDGSSTAVEALNNDNGEKGIALGFSEDFFVKFRLVSIVAGNPASLPEGEYDRRHIQILKSALEYLDSPYIIGTCSWYASLEKEPARDHKAILMAQVGPPGFYTDENPYVFGFHINSDDYPLPAVQSLGFVATETQRDPSTIPVRVIYRTKSEFFYSTCRSAIDKLKGFGFTDIKEILYDHSGDHDGDGEINQFDVDFLHTIADEGCPPGSGATEDFHPALFACTLTEHDIILERWSENGCRPISTWVTAATWGWANENPGIIPYFQGGGQWHEAFDYSDKYFRSGWELLLHNQEVFGYLGNYDQVVVYAIPVLYAQHLQASYRVEDSPDPIRDFGSEEGREHLRRDMIVLNVPTIFGPVAFNEYQRNIGRSAAGTQWLPLGKDGTFRNALVSPFLQAEAGTVIPSPASLPCNAGLFLNETMRRDSGSLLAAACAKCPVDTFTKDYSQQTECEPCPEGSTTEGLEGQKVCIRRNDNLISNGILIFGYVASGASYMLSIFFIAWLIKYRKDPVVRVSQFEFLMLICIGALVSSSTVVALSFQAGTGEDTTAASIGCAIAPFLYAIGWVLQYSSLSAKTYRLYYIMRNKTEGRRVTATTFQMFKIVLAALAVDLVILICWLKLSPLEYERSEESTSIDEEAGIITISTVGRCVSSTDETGFWAFAGPLITFHVALVIFTNALLYNVREVGDRYQERKYVGLASMLMFEILAVGIPVLVSVQDNPTAMFIVLTGIIALDDIGILSFIFVPKIMFQIKGLEEGVATGESIMKETHKRASTREFAKRGSSHGDPPSSGGSGGKSTIQMEKDSFTDRIGAHAGKSPFIKKELPRTHSATDLPSNLILEETSEELKKCESDFDDTSSRSLVYAAGTFPTSAASGAVPGLRAKKRTMETQLSSGSLNKQEQTQPAPVIPSDSANSTNSVGDTSSALEEQQRMIEVTKHLMEEHQRMMQATALILNQHERLKQRLEAAQTPRADDKSSAVQIQEKVVPLNDNQQNSASQREMMLQLLLNEHNRIKQNSQSGQEANDDGASNEETSETNTATGMANNGISPRRVQPSYRRTDITGNVLTNYGPVQEETQQRAAANNSREPQSEVTAETADESDVSNS